MEKKFSNHLINETSIYLLQHAHNPVDWFPWGNDAISKAQKEDKPILVSIGYAACHWCHVMERESFEDEETAALMNELFINIKVDREERPDLDHIYMDAVQTIAGNGGWPLNVFLTPELKPFYGGTYFPPVAAFNRSSWKDVITAVATAYRNKKQEIIEQAESLSRHISNNNNLIRLPQNNSGLNKELLKTIAEQLLNSADKVWGGFGSAPKFPQTFSILYLLRHYYFAGDEDALKQAELSLDKMMMGGMYDHLGGGFARYSTDKKWQIPHFEKMLYDNALLIDIYTEAYQLTKKQEYANVVDETIQFIQNELKAPEGGFYSALDADSEGVEGKYYVWNKNETDTLLGNGATIFSSVFNISEQGNWDETNILWQTETMDFWSEKFGIEKKQLAEKINSGKKTLLEERKKRIRPTLDNKILLSWNALMIKSLCKSSAAFENENYLEVAVNCIEFIENNLQSENGSFYHSWNKFANKQEAFLDDYAALIQAYIYLFQVTDNENYLLRAKKLAEQTIEKFGDEESLLFYFTKNDQADIIVRKKEVYDGATPSGNSMMAENLFLLSVYFDLSDWKAKADKMIASISSIAEKYPLSFGYWILNTQAALGGLKEIAIVGNDAALIKKQVLKEYIPAKVLQASGTENYSWPLLKGKKNSQGTDIYLCEDYKCRAPFKNMNELKVYITKTFFNKISRLIK